MRQEEQQESQNINPYAKLHRGLFFIWLLTSLATLTILTTLAVSLSQTIFRYEINSNSFELCYTQGIEQSTLVRLSSQKKIQFAIIVLLGVEEVALMGLNVMLSWVFCGGRKLYGLYRILGMSGTLFCIWLDLICFGNILRSIIDFNAVSSCINDDLARYKEGLYLPFALVIASAVFLLAQLLGYVFFQKQYQSKEALVQHSLKPQMHSKRNVCYQKDSIPEQIQLSQEIHKTSIKNYDKRATPSKNSHDKLSKIKRQDSQLDSLNLHSIDKLQPQQTYTISQGKNHNHNRNSNYNYNELYQTGEQHLTFNRKSRKKIFEAYTHPLQHSNMRSDSQNKTNLGRQQYPKQHSHNEHLTFYNLQPVFQDQNYIQP